MTPGTFKKNRVSRIDLVEKDDRWEVRHIELVTLSVFSVCSQPLYFLCCYTRMDCDFIIIKNNESLNVLTLLKQE